MIDNFISYYYFTMRGSSHKLLVLVVCPASLKSNWASKIQKWIPSATVSIDAYSQEGQVINLHGSGADIYITDYGRMEDVINYFGTSPKPASYDLLVFDESHYLKNPKTKRSKLAKQLSINASKVLMLINTPILNRSKELLSQLDI